MRLANGPNFKSTGYTGKTVHALHRQPTHSISGTISKWNGTECISSNFRSVKRAKRLGRPVQFTGQTRWPPAWPLASWFGA